MINNNLINDESLKVCQYLNIDRAKMPLSFYSFIITSSIGRAGRIRRRHLPRPTISRTTIPIFVAPP
jgi:hypothetical protein